MDDIESSFKALLGRQPSDKEVERLYRVKNALNIRDNDAMWMILMALESYDTLYSKYPALIADQVDVVVEKQRELIAEIVDAESKSFKHTVLCCCPNKSTCCYESSRHCPLASLGLGVFWLNWVRCVVPNCWICPWQRKHAFLGFNSSVK